MNQKNASIRIRIYWRCAVNKSVVDWWHQQMAYYWNRMLYTHIIYTLLAKSMLVQGDKVLSTVCMQEGERTGINSTGKLHPFSYEVHLQSEWATQSWRGIPWEIPLGTSSLGSSSKHHKSLLKWMVSLTHECKHWTFPSAGTYPVATKLVWQQDLNW